MAAKSKGMKAYVLIETAPGKTKAIRKALGSVSKGSVANLDAVTGPYDFIAVFVSTGRVHDHALPIPFHEDTPRNLYWGEYAKNKIDGEDAYLGSGLPASVVRPTHVFGPLNTRNNETFFFDRLVRGRPVLVPGPGGWLRQFGHVEDLADAMAAMLGDRRAFGRAYNVSGEESITQVGFVELIAA